MDDLGNRIFEARRRLGLSQAGFGRLVGVSWNYICQIENGKRQPGNGLRKKIEKTLKKL